MLDKNVSKREQENKTQTFKKKGQDDNKTRDSTNAIFMTVSDLSWQANSDFYYLLLTMIQKHFTTFFWWKILLYVCNNTLIRRTRCRPLYPSISPGQRRGQGCGSRPGRRGSSPAALQCDGGTSWPDGGDRGTAAASPPDRSAGAPSRTRSSPPGPASNTHTHTYPQFSTYMCSKNQGEKITIDIYGSGPKRLKFKTYTQTNDQYLSDTSK